VATGWLRNLIEVINLVSMEEEGRGLLRFFYLWPLRN